MKPMPYSQLPRLMPGTYPMPLSPKVGRWLPLLVIAKAISVIAVMALLLSA